MEPLLRGIALAIGASDSPEVGLDVAVEVMTRSNQDLGGTMHAIPDRPEFRQALTAWGIEIGGASGPSLSQMFGSIKTMQVKLPEGWKVSYRGGGGHNELLDNKGAARLWWHIHGWDPIATRIENRFRIDMVDLGMKQAAYQVMKGGVSIHAIPFEYPHARTDTDTGNGRTYYFLNRDLPDYNQQSRDNYKAKEDMYAVAKGWLDAHRPGWQDDPLKSWLD